MDLNKIYNDLKAIPNCKTKDIDRYNKQLIKNKEDVSSLKEYIHKYSILYRTYFQVSLGLMASYQEQFAFIEKNVTLLQDWYHVDMLTQFIKQPIDFSFAYKKATLYINSPLPFLRRWGYVLFLMKMPKEEDDVARILKLFKDDDEYYVQMAEAWLLQDLAVNNFDLVYNFIKTSPIKYNILGKAIQKICDSFKMTKLQKQMVKDLRENCKKNRLE